MGNRLILIAGQAGSGTTFMAALLKGLGYDLGTDADVSNDRNEEAGKQVRGIEHKPLRQLCVSWTMRLFPGFIHASPRAVKTAASPIGIDDPIVADRIREEVAKVSADLPTVVKQPIMARWLALWLLAGGKRPDFTIFTMRNTIEASISGDRDGFGTHTVNERRIMALFDNGFFLETLILNDLRWAPVCYPRSVEDPEHVWNALPFVRWEHSYEDYVAAWKRVADPSLVRVGPADVAAFRNTKVVDPSIGGWDQIRVEDGTHKVVFKNSPSEEGVSLPA